MVGKMDNSVAAKLTATNLASAARPKILGHIWNEFFCAKLRLITWNLFWPILLLHHWLEPNPAFTSQIWGSKFGARIARCEKVDMGMYMSFPRFGRRMWDVNVDAAAHSHLAILAPNLEPILYLGCKCRVRFKSMMEQKYWQKLVFRYWLQIRTKNHFKSVPILSGASMSRGQWRSNLNPTFSL